MLVVQDIFLTETAAWPTWCCRPRPSPRRPAPSPTPTALVQMGRQALALPGQARQDLWIITALAQRWAWTGRHYGAAHRLPRGAAAVFDEMRGVMPSIAGITWQRLEREHAVTYPCDHEGDPGEPVVFTDHFPPPAAARALRAGRHRAQPTSSPMPTTRWC
jgi:formate dehydrogenase major subunit